MPSDSTKKQREKDQTGGHSGSAPGQEQDTGQPGGPGPHGSSDPQTDERNKNKPLTDDWGKGDKH